MRIVLSFLIFAFFSSVWAAPTEISLTGHLGKEEMERARGLLEEAGKQDAPLLILEISSSSGDLREALSFAKDLYQVKQEKNAKVIVYINDEAIGPAAIFPFLADELYISFFVVWGDIPIGADTSLPTNILRSRVRSLVNPEHPKNDLLQLMAAAMTDPNLSLVGNGEWKIGGPEEGRVVSPKGETLVVNQNQLRKLELVDGVLSLSKFREEYFPKKAVEAPKKEMQEKGLDARLSKAIQYDPNGPNKIGYIAIDDKAQISQATWIYIKNALDYYKKNPPKFLILELNTPGGEVFASQKISDALKELDTQHSIPVVSFIDNWAISAGAMLAYSTRFISATKDASMGAAEPVMPGSSGQMESAAEKVNSALRSDFASRASFFDRNSDIAEAMVDKDIILVWRHGKVVKLNDEDQIRKGGQNPDEIITTKGKLLTLSTDEMLRYGVADIKLSTAKLDLITASEREKGKWPASKMLLFQNPFFEKIPNAIVDAYRMDWKTQFLMLLSYPAVSSLLFLGMMFGFYTELNSPGFGIAGSFAIICLVLIMISSFAMDIAHVLEVVLLLAGLILVALDLFLIPTFGLLGIAGIVLFIIGLFGMMLPGIESFDYEWDTQTLNAAGRALFHRLAWLSGTIVFGIMMIFLFARYFAPSFGAFSRLSLIGGEQNASEGYIAGAMRDTLPQEGEKGVVISTLRPAGKIEIRDQIFDAIALGEYIEKGTSIVVKELDGSVIVVDEDHEVNP